MVKFCMQNSKYSDLITKEWLKRVLDDELNAKSLLKHRDGTPNGVCFLTQQMAEKLLKAYLVEVNNKYPKIHSLNKLLEDCIKVDNEFLQLKGESLYLNEFYIPVRYPDFFVENSWIDAEKAMTMAKKIKNLVLKKINIILYTKSEKDK